MKQAHRLYVGTIGQGVFRSLDGGETFARACDGMFVECHVRALTVHPSDPRTLYLGTEQGLYFTTNGADSWTQIDSPMDGMQIWSVLFVPGNPNIILAGTCPSRLFLSEDGGKTWAEPDVKMERDCPRIMHTRVTSLLADPDHPQTLWAGVEIDGVYHSGNGGRGWQPVGNGLSSRDIHGLIVVPRNGKSARLLASTNNDLNVSLDGGLTWQPQKMGHRFPWSYCRGLGQMAGRPETAFLGMGDWVPGSVGTIARSVDGGVTWEEARLPNRANSTIWNFATHAAEPDLVYASSVAGEIYRSWDGGENWEKLAREFGEIRALAWTP